MNTDPFSAARDGDLAYLKFIIEKENYNVNQSKWSGWTLLHRAAENGHTDVCEMLVLQGAKVNLKTTWGWLSPTHLALGNGWKETAAYLIEAGANGRQKNKDGQTPAEYANVKGYRDLARIFDNVIDQIAETKKAAEDHKRMKRLADMQREKAKLMEDKANKAKKKAEPVLETPKGPLQSVVEL